MIKHNEENIEKLAKVVVEDWDMDTLLTYALERLMDYFKHNKAEFKDAWKDKFEEGDLK